MSDNLLWDDIDFEKRIEEARLRLDEGLSVLASVSGTPERLRDEEFAEALMVLMSLVLKKDKEVNLTAITDPVEFVELHLLDSLSAAVLPKIIASTGLVDIGAGAGFPGLPLALLFPDKSFVLADALRKRVDFINYAAGVLEMTNVVAEHARAEVLGQELVYRERFDVALCRAVASLPVALEYAMPLVRVGGVGVFYKTIRTEEEIEDSRVALKLLGANNDVRVVANKELLPERAHALYVVNKDRPTPQNYPRRDGKPKKAPL